MKVIIYYLQLRTSDVHSLRYVKKNLINCPNPLKLDGFSGKV